MKNETIAPGEKLVAALGLQPGEDYGQAEECHSHETTLTFCGRKIEVYFDEMAGPFSQWNAFCLGIGTKSGLERADVIARIKTAIRSEKQSASELIDDAAWNASQTLGASKTPAFTKYIDHAYAGSPLAIQRGFGKSGCWILHLKETGHLPTIASVSARWENVKRSGEQCVGVPWNETYNQFQDGPTAKLKHAELPCFRPIGKL